MTDPGPRAQGGDDEAIRALVKRLSRAHRSGGRVIERAAIVAAGPHSAAVMTWITAHDGQPEPLAAAKPQRGLLARREETAHAPLRYVLPADALD